jgi:hypothetical protein
MLRMFCYWRSLLSEVIGEKFQLNESIKYDVLKNLAGDSIDDETLKRIQNGDDFGIKQMKILL